LKFENRIEVIFAVVNQRLLKAGAAQLEVDGIFDVFASWAPYPLDNSAL
jgi:hypothetical protein